MKELLLILFILSLTGLLQSCGKNTEVHFVDHVTTNSTKIILIEKTVKCSSINYNTQNCIINSLPFSNEYGMNNFKLVSYKVYRVLSVSDCTDNFTMLDDFSITVYNGCRAIFKLRYEIEL